MFSIFSEFVFPMFSLLAVNLAIFDLKFGFLVKNCIYSHLDMSRIPEFDQNMTPAKKGKKNIRHRYRESKSSMLRLSRLSRLA